MKTETIRDFASNVFAKGVTRFLQTEFGRDAALNAAEAAMLDERVQENASQAVDTHLQAFTQDLKHDATGIVHNVRESLEQGNVKNTYDRIKESIVAPQDGIASKFIKKTIARVLDIGVSVAGFVGAAFFDKYIKPEQPVGRDDFKHIFAIGIAGIARMFGPKQVVQHA